MPLPRTTLPKILALGLAALLPLLPSCKEHWGEDPRALAVERLQGFKKAIALGDRKKIRRMVSIDSRTAVDHLPKKGRADEGFRILATESSSPIRVRVHVEDPDPSAANRRGVFVVIREEGEWRVDLVATAGLNRLEHWNGGPSHRLVPAYKDRATLEARIREAGHLLKKH